MNFDKNDSENQNEERLSTFLSKLIWCLGLAPKMLRAVVVCFECKPRCGSSVVLLLHRPIVVGLHMTSSDQQCSDVSAQWRTCSAARLRVGYAAARWR